MFWSDYHSEAKQGWWNAAKVLTPVFPKTWNTWTNRSFNQLLKLLFARFCFAYQLQTVPQSTAMCIDAINYITKNLPIYSHVLQSRQRGVKILQWIWSTQTSNFVIYLSIFKRGLHCCYVWALVSYIGAELLYLSFIEPVKVFSHAISSKGSVKIQVILLSSTAPSLFSRGYFSASSNLHSFP